MGMQGLPAKGGERGLRRLRQKRRFGAEAGPIDRVAQKRMTERGQMDPNLMGPAGFEPADQETCHCLGPVRASLLGVRPRRLGGAVALQRLPERYGFASALAHRQAGAVER